MDAYGGADRYPDQGRADALEVRGRSEQKGGTTEGGAEGLKEYSGGEAEELDGFG